MPSDLSKRERKIARALIEQSVEKEFETGLKEAEAILVGWKNKKLSSREAFHKLRDHMNDFRKYLARRYDDRNTSHSTLLIAAILKDGYITEEDIKDFSEEAKEQIKRTIRFCQENDDVNK